MFKRNGIFYMEDAQTGTQTSLRTRSSQEAQLMLASRLQAVSQPHLNLAMAKVYLAGSRPELLTRTWNEVAKEVEAGYTGPTYNRWRKFTASAPMQSLLKLLVIQTAPEDFLAVLRHAKAGVSTNVWLRILHNRAVDLGWALQPIMSKRNWPKVRYGKRRAITEEEHLRILRSENLLVYQLYYQLCWELGASQSDVAKLHSRDIQYSENCITFQRQKLKTQDKGISIVPMGQRIREILNQLPQEGYLFPHLAQMREDTRASHFKKVCLRANVVGVTLHSYRYSWASRAKRAGVPLREAMSHLGHSSRAVHIAYAAEMNGGAVLPLEYYESQMALKILGFQDINTKCA
jgi:integrase